VTGFRCEGVGLSYPSPRGTVEALADVSFAARDHEFVCVVGPSGCGKTTLLKILAGLLSPTTGALRFDDDNPPVSALVFQEHGLYPWMTVRDNVAFGLERQGLPRRERRAAATAFIDRVGLGAFGDRYPHELSGGMRQRVGIARALVSEGGLLLMDEPFGSLDAQTRLVLQEELLRTWRDERRLVVYVTHDIEEALLLGDRVLVMSGRPGRVREDLSVPFPRPRERSVRDDPELGELKWHIWRLLEDDVRTSLSISR